MFILGFFIGNVNTFLVITCPADLGRAHSARATATITGIIDGIGSAGFGIGQLVIGYTIERYGWTNGYWLVISSTLAATIIPLGIIFCQELAEIRQIQAIENQLRRANEC